MYTAKVHGEKERREGVEWGEEKNNSTCRYFVLVPMGIFVALEIASSSL